MIAAAPSIELFGSHGVFILLVGIAIFAAAILPRFLHGVPLSVPIVLLGFGYAAFALPLGFSFPSFSENVEETLLFTELAVIVSLMGAGLKIDRRVGWKTWGGTWRLIGITMMITIAICALAGWWIVGLVPATALLLGSVLAPTDPVLASEIQVGPPREADNDSEISEEEKDFQEEELGKKEEDERDEFRFTLTSEAGLNDALAFPFVNAAIAMIALGAAPSAWFAPWFGIDVVYKLVIGIVSGIVFGRLLGSLILSTPGDSELAKALLGPTALAATLILYGATEMFGGYGFLAVFVGAIVMRGSCWEHEYHDSLYRFAEMLERLLSAFFLLALGGAVAGGLFDELTLELVLVGLIVFFIARPLGGLIGLVGFDRASWRERLAISFFGVRGVGSFYYLAYALQAETFPGEESLWALVGFVVTLSIVVHGITAMPMTRLLEKKG